MYELWISAFNQNHGCLLNTDIDLSPLQQDLHPQNLAVW